MNLFRERSGFTVIEIVAVMAVTAALVVFAAGAMWSSIDNFRFSAAVNKVLGDIRYAQHLARTHNGWYGIEFYPSPTNSYHVYYTTGASDTDVQDPSNPAETLSVDLDSEYGSEISAVDIGGGTKVEFNPLGTPYLDKTGAALPSTGTIEIKVGGNTRTIQIFKNTGKVELQ